MVQEKDHGGFPHVHLLRLPCEFAQETGNGRDSPYLTPMGCAVHTILGKARPKWPWGQSVPL
jgi:hypothetical protein